MKRLFTFGCSYTKYTWPTWATFLGLYGDFDLYENWGKPGAGNRYIFDSLMEADLRHNFTPDDVVIVEWSSHQRFDFYHEIEGEWKTWGSIFSNPEVDHPWITKYWSMDAAVMHTFNFIHASQELLNNKTTWHMCAMDDLLDFTYQTNTDLHVFGKVLDRYPDNWCNQIRCYDSTADEEYHRWDAEIPDTHPTPEMHLKWLQDELPNYNLDIKGCHDLLDEFKGLMAYGFENGIARKQSDDRMNNLEPRPKRF